MSKVNRVALDTDSIFVQRFKGLIGETRTLTAIAEELDVSRPTISNWLLGHCEPDQAAALRIAKHYNVSVNWLQGLSDNPTTDTSIEAICNYTGLSEAALNSLVQLMNNDNLGLTNKGTSYKECINSFFTNPNFEPLIIALKLYFSTLHKRNSLQQKLSQELKNENTPIKDINKQAADITYQAITTLKDISTNKADYASKLSRCNEDLEIAEFRVQKSMSNILSYYNNDKKEGD